MAGITGVGAAGSAVALAAVSAWLISAAALQPPILTLMVAIVSVRAFGIARGVLRYVERLVAHDAAFRILADLRVRTVRRLERLAPTGTADLRGGDVLSRFVSDVDALADVWLRLLLPLSVTIVVAGGAVLLVGAMVPVAGLALAVSVAVTLALAPALARRWSAKSQAAVIDLRGAVAAQTAELVAAGPELVVFGQQGVALGGLADLDEQLAAAERRNAHAAGAASALATAAAGAAVVVAAATGVHAVSEGSLEGVLLAVVVLTPLALGEVIATLAPAAGLTPSLRASARRVQAIIDRPDPVPPVPEPASPPSGPVGLELKGVTAGWGSPSPAVLKDASLRINPGERVAIVGPSGSGKSTTALILARLLVPRSGLVALVDARGRSHDLAELDDDAVRGVVGLVEQDAYLFDSTIEENLRLARPEADDAALADALRRVQLGPWVEGLPDGIKTFVGEHGARVSGGQRRRLAVARVLLADHRVVVLDEPAEHLDAETAQTLMADVLGALQGRTLVLITHRAEHALLVERQIRLEGGSFVDQPVT
jgi:thiol reductant ABC exporter CydC subunit